jgi:hypothetical protein
MVQVYIIPAECVEHLMDEDNVITDREKAKRIGVKCGELFTLIDFEREVNNGDLEISNKSVILID